MEQYQQRVVDEKSALDGLIEKLEQFASSDKFLTLDQAEQNRMSRQQIAMRGYSETLAQRIAAFTGSPIPPTIRDFTTLEFKALLLRIGSGLAASLDESRDNEISANKYLRRELDARLQELRRLPSTRERSLAITKLQECEMWLGMDLKRLGGPAPYPTSRDPSSTTVEPTADGLKM